ncbi:MAG: lytic transglycosylase domain-containing protein [Rhizobiaceae bacterium]|nr:lytic transglycosylase domain-containing protein [Rhizobiaceae bacterium]
MLRTGRPNPIVASVLLAFVPVIAFGGAVPGLLGFGLPAAVEAPSAGDPLATTPPVSTETTTSIKDKVAFVPDLMLPTGGSTARLKAGLDAISSGDAAEALRIRDSLDADSIDRRILTWALAMGGSLSGDATAGVLAAMPDWPGAATLHRNVERAVAREKRKPAEIVAAFADSPPRTTQGIMALARAELDLGDKDGARALIVPLWRTEKLEAKVESRILQDFGDVLTKEDHRFRLERMLYAERVQSALRLAERGGAPNLVKAWSAVIRGDKAARKLLDAVPEAERGAGYLYAEAKLLRRKKKFAEAADVMAKAPRDPVALVDPDEWWVDRRVLSRELLDRGDVAAAYRLAAEHSAQSPVNIADAEFHAGWYALRGLSDPVLASKHFARIAEIAEGPITSARAYYWLGRAAEAGAPGDAKAYYEKAAIFSTAFYGQLASVKLGRAVQFADPVPSDAEAKAFAARDAVRALKRIERAGDGKLAATLYRELALQIESPGELALLVNMAERRGEHQLALRVGKLAAARGINVGTLSHPVGAIPASADISGAGKALAYAIARQESEFNVSAVSGAGALGLLQLLPGTAEEFARKTGLPYSKARLTTDAGYNATLGASFLSEQLSRFAGSYVLTFAGYNAGPRRAQDWVKRYGDPRGQDLDTVVDWIERIPFTETRSYVQRVMENYQVYKTRLSGTFNIADDLVKGR